MDTDGLLYYDLGQGVEAFSTMRDALLPYPVVQAHQVHGIRIAHIDRPGVTREELEGYDALITNVAGVAIGARSADCIPVLLHDPVSHTVAAVHSGWRGTVQKISAEVVREMALEYGSKPENIRAVIGPGIGPDSFQVGEEVALAFRTAGFPMERIWEFQGPTESDRSLDAADSAAPRSMAGGHHINLWEACRITLMACGVPEGSIAVAGIDTYTHPEFFSARREGKACGRIINVIKLK